MSKKYKMLRLLATTSIIATNIFPVIPQLPKIVVQAATSQEEQEASATEESNTSTERPKEETSTSQSEDTPSSSEEQPLQESDTKDSKNQEADSSKEPIASGARIINGTWGTSAYTFDESTGTMTVYAGTLGENGQQPWSKGEVSPDQIKKIELVGDVVAPTDSGYLFSSVYSDQWLTNLTEITGKLDVSQTTSLYAMMWNCSSLKSIDVSDWDTSQVTSMQGVFNTCSSLETVDVNNWNTSQVTDMKNVFKNCSNLTNIDVSKWDTNNVQDFTSFFYGCSQLRSIDVSTWRTEQVVWLNGMFYGCSSLESIELSAWNTDKVSEMKDTFSGCINLVSLDLSGWNTGNTNDMSNMFKDCTNLNEFTLGTKSVFDSTVNLPDGSWIGKNSNTIYSTSVDLLTNYDGSQPETFVKTDNSWGTAPYIFNDSTGTLTIYSGTLEYYGSGNSPWDKGEISANSIKKIELVGDVVAPQDSSYLFSSITKENRLTNLQEITGNLDTSNTTNFSYVFRDASSLTEVESNWDTSKFKKMYGTFWGCTSLADLNVSNWNVSQVDDMSYTFDGCSSLTELDVSNWNIGNVTLLYGTFLNCTSLTKLDVSKWDTSKVTVMDSTFLFCESLTDLDVSDWDTSQVTTLSALFRGCKNLENLNVSKWNTSQVTNMNATFNTCSKLKSLDVSGWNTSSVTDMAGMFYNSSSLSTIDVSNWDISQVKSLRATFQGCSSLTSLDVSNWTTSKVESMYTTFQDCTNLTNLTVSGWDTSQVTDMHSMFDGCENLKELNLNNWNTAQVKDLTHTFSNCSSLTELKVDNWDIGQVTDLYSTFNNCSSLLNLDLSSWKNTDKLENISFAFEGCSSLTDLNISSWDTSSLKTIFRAFALCSSLTTLDLNNWDTGNVTEMGALFYNCSSLTNLNVSAWDTSSVINMPSVFNGCTNLISIDVSGWNTASATNMQNIFKGCDSLNELTLGKNSVFDTSVSLLEGKWTGKNTNVEYLNTNAFLTNYDGSQPDTFVRTDPSEMKYWGTSPYTFDETTGTLTVYAGELDSSAGSPWNKGDVAAGNIKKIVIEGHVIAPANSAYLFSDDTKKQFLTNLVEITGLSNLDTSNVSGMDSIFYNCSSLSSLDVSGWNTSNVTDMSSIFSGCSSITSLDVNSWNTSNVTTMKTMFTGCSSLSSLEVSSWDTSKVTTMSSMFQDCSSLQSLDLGHFDTSNVTNMGYMFGYCSSLQSLDLSSFDTSKATTYVMFINCDNLRSIKLGSKFKFGGDTRFDDYPTHKWVGINTHVRYGSGADLADQYDGTQPDTYVWDISSQLGVTIENQDSMTVGQEDSLVWTIKHTSGSSKGRTAKSIQGKVMTTETFDFAPELLVEEQDTLGNYVGTLTIPLIDEGITHDEHTYSYSLPDLSYGNQYKVTLKGTPWNNTTVSTAPTFQYELNYDANLELVNGEMVLPDSRSATSNRVVENGGLSFKDVPQELRFTSTKLSTNLNEQLIAREEKDWGIGITDFRGTKAKSTTDPDVVRKDWELVATVAPFKDSSNQEIGLDALGVTYVDETNTQHELSGTETLLNHHEVSGETPKEHHEQQVKWSEEKGLQAVVHDRNQLKTNETYQADVTFELRSAP